MTGMKSQPCPECGTLLAPPDETQTVHCPGCGGEVVLETTEARKARLRLARPGGPPISFHCPACGQPMQAASEQAGKSGTCSSCGESVEVPYPDPEQVAAYVPPAPVRLPWWIPAVAATVCAALFGLLGGMLTGWFGGFVTAAVSAGLAWWIAKMAAGRYEAQRQSK